MAYEQHTATIAASSATSGEVDLEGGKLVGVIMPAAWDAATLSVQASTASGGTFADVYSSAGAQVSWTVAASQYIAIDPATVGGVEFVKLVSSATQTAQRDLTVIVEV